MQFEEAKECIFLSLGSNAALVGVWGRLQEWRVGVVWGRQWAAWGREDSQSQGAEKGKGSLPFYFLQKLQWRLLWLWVYRTGFVHFREEGFESEFAAKCWKQPLGRNRSKSQVAWGNLDVICVHQHEDISLSVCLSFFIYLYIYLSQELKSNIKSE